MTTPSVSVVVVSRGRPNLLRRCLLGISQLQYGSFEVVVVADSVGLETVATLPFLSDLKTVAFEEANISAARNLGISHAAGDIVAFIDDDSVPEPQWLHCLVAPAAQADVASMGGFVRGRNGISWQWTARSLDPMGEPLPLEISHSATTVLRPPEGRAIKTEGTNMAFRRSVLIELGGFDPAFHYFLDETDLNMRLSQAGHAVAMIPQAEVHHGFAPNLMRRADRVPLDLFDIGASWAAFQRKHVPQENRRAQWLRLRTNERHRLLRYLMSGGLEPRDVRHLMQRLDEGYNVGLTREIGGHHLPSHPVQGFRAFPSQRRHSSFVVTRPLGLSLALRKAAERVAKGEIITVLCLSLTALYHQAYFSEDGVWVQKGGLFGRSERTAPLVAWWTRSARIRAERQRIAIQRGLGNN